MDLTPFTYINPCGLEGMKVTQLSTLGLQKTCSDVATELSEAIIKQFLFMTNTTKQRGADKVSRIPIKITPTEKMLRKPEWIRIKVTNSAKVTALKKNH